VRWGPQRRSALLRTDTAGFSELSYGGHNQVGKYDAVIRPNWLVEASIARAQNKIRREPPSVRPVERDRQPARR
jgi:hypothetical protein